MAGRARLLSLVGDAPYGKRMMRPLPYAGSSTLAAASPCPARRSGRSRHEAPTVGCIHGEPNRGQAVATSVEMAWWPSGRTPAPSARTGLADMSGNVWEWTRSPLQPYPFDPRRELVDPAGPALWVMRGGSFADNVRNVRTGVRGAAGPDVRRPFIGFRIAISTL